MQKYAATPSQNVSTATLVFLDGLRNLALQGLCYEGDDMEKSVLPPTNLNVDTISCFPAQQVASFLCQSTQPARLGVTFFFFNHAMQTVLWQVSDLEASFQSPDKIWPSGSVSNHSPF